MNDTLSLFGNIASILGATISAYVLYDLRKLHLLFLLRARLPELIKSLAKQTSYLSIDMSSFRANKRDFLTNLGRCESIIKSIHKKVRGNERTFTRKLLKSLHAKKDYSIDEAWEIYNELQALIVALKQYEKDIKWS